MTRLCRYQILNFMPHSKIKHGTAHDESLVSHPVISVKPRAAKKKSKAKRSHINANSNKGFNGGKRSFPRFSIEECRKIADALKTFNAGNPWSPRELAKSANTGVGTSYFNLTASSRDYGFTVGTREASKIELTDLGRRLVYPKSPAEELEAIHAAFMSVPLFKKVYEYYQGQNLPDIQYLKNTLKTAFGLGESFQDEFYEVYQKNLTYLRSKSGSSGQILPPEPGSGSIVVGEAVNSGGLVAFVAMPFSEKTAAFARGYFDEVLKHLITPAAVRAKFTARTAKKSGSEVIQSTIVNDLDMADLVIVDLTEHNPNVLFELGMRIAFNKPVCLIRAKGTSAIFDIDHMLRVYDYNPCLWQSTLDIDIPALTEHILETWRNTGKERSYLSILRENR